MSLKLEGTKIAWHRAGCKTYELQGHELRGSHIAEVAVRCPMTPPKPDSAPAYRAAGVSLAASDETTAQIRSAVTATYTPNVLAGLGAFGGLFSAGALKAMDAPVLVASTDGVGTKTKVAAALSRNTLKQNDTRRFGALGQDLVNHCVNDLLVQNARPLFFLDYVASGKLEPSLTAALITGVAEGCRAHGIPLLGGETAEMPGVYVDGEFDLVGTLIGVAERSKLVTGERITAGDIILGLASGGLQTNGFSLARHVLADYDEPLGDSTVGNALLAPHRSFLAALEPVLDAGLVRGMAHITGGGLPGNLPRSLPSGLGAVLTPNWNVPEIFTLLERRGNTDREEMFSVFNMGVGFVFVVSPEDLEAALELTPEAFTVGKVVRGEGVQLR